MVSATSRPRPRPGGPRRPRRPSRAVFWRRRLVLLGVVLLLVWGMTRMVGGEDDPTASSQDAPAPPAPTSAAPTATTTPTATAAPKQRTRKERDVQVDLSTAAGACDPAGLTVRPSVPGGAYAGGTVPLRLAFSTTARTACSLDLGATELLVDVARKGSSVWSTRACPAAVPQRTVQVEPTWSTTVDVVWSGRRDGEECAGDEALLPAGEYAARAAVLGGEPGEAEFTLRTRPKPKPTPSVAPSAKPSAAPTAKPGAKPSATPAG